MDKEVLSFKELNIERLPDFDIYNYSITDLKPKINIIYGPNATGKTTLAKSFQYLLWPNQAPENGILTGEFRLGDNNWQAEVNLGRGRYFKEGSKTNLNFIPAVEYRDRYYLALHDLLQKETKNESLAQIILKESAGGYQVSKAIEELDFKNSFAKRKNKQTKKAAKRIKKYQEVISRQEELEQEEKRLEELEKELEEIDEAKQELKLIDQAIEYATAKDKLVDLENRKEEFPEQLSKLVGNELKELEEFKNEIEEGKIRIDEAEKKIVASNQEIAEIKLPPKGIKEEKLVCLKEKANQLQTKEKEIESLELKIKKAKQEREEKKKNFTSEVREEKLAELDKLGYDELNQFAKKAEEVNNKLQALKSFKNLLNLENINNEAKNIERKIASLEDWLQVPKSETDISKPFFIIGGLIAVLAIILGSLINPIIFSFLAIAIFVIVYGVLKRSEQSNVELKANIEKRVNLSDINSLQKWTRNKVKSSLDQLYQRKSEIELAKRKEQSWQEKEEEYEILIEEKEKFEGKRKELIARFGVAPNIDEQSLYYLTYHLNRWQDAQSNLVLSKKELEEVESSYQKILKEINDIFSDYATSLASNYAEVKGRIADLESRNNILQGAIKDKKQAEDNKKLAQNSLEKFKEKKKKLFTRLNLEVDAVAKLREFCERHEDYKTLKKNLDKASAVAKQEENKLRSYNNFNKALLDLEIESLEEKKRDLKEKAGNYREVQGDIDEIKRDIKDAKKGNSLEEAWHKREDALNRLEKDLENDYDKLIGYVLGEQIRKEDSPANRSQVFKEAQKIFTTITSGSYKLKFIQGEAASFSAIDTVANKVKRLDQLSSGTRVQLLLAVRMAFVATQEQGVALPLYLDETLANADDRRAKEIIKAVIALAKTGRQCFYFTAQKDEVRKWNTLVAKESDLEANLVRLEKNTDNSYFDLGVDSFKEEELIINQQEVPSAKEYSASEYKKELALPDFNPYQGAQRAHLWYLVEDLELLEYLLKLGVKSWGQLKVLLKNKSDDFFFKKKKESISKVEERGYLLEEFVRLWKKGRGKAVKYSALKDSGAVSSNFIEEVFKLAKEVNYKGEELINKLRQRAVDRFRTDKMDQLEEYLKEEGYIVAEKPMPIDDIRARLIGQANGENAQKKSKQVDKLLNKLR